MPDLPTLRAPIATATLTLLLSGCSIHGSYPDAAETDAAKLRFISGLDSATLAVFDAQHCGGRTTGILNNLFIANTSRRADMSIAAPPDAKAYLEIRLKPDSEVVLQVNTQGRSSVCGSMFSYTPQSGAEYELTFDYSGKMCRALLNRLHQVGDQVSRSPVPLLNNGLPACAGSNALFPKALVAQPDTQERVSMIEQIIAESLTESMQAEQPQLDRALLDESFEKRIDERTRRMGFTLPKEYWKEYQQNIDIAAQELSTSNQRTLKRYEDEYRKYLRQLDTAELSKLVPNSASTDKNRVLTVKIRMLRYYRTASSQVLRENLSNHLTRMADLDKRYAVCERFADCWKN
ncbi:hypothetical protein [Pseudomonas sp.]|uniref:hypothetical protein n=1 Tax=Pseudomonas sp. TaxID=306 RepID=UPI003A96E08C